MSIRLPYEPSWRDEVAWRLANAVLRLATPTYRALIAAAITVGLDEARRQTAAEEGKP